MVSAVILWAFVHALRFLRLRHPDHESREMFGDAVCSSG
jgi:hypothetical protein